MEHTTEIMVYFGVGIVLVGLVAGFMMNWDFSGILAGLQKVQNQTGSSSAEFRHDHVSFITAARDFWDFCNHSHSSDSMSYYVFNSTEKMEGELTKEMMFEQYKKLGWCMGIQSKDFACGTRDDVSFNNDSGNAALSLPRIVRLRCENRTLFVDGG